MAALSSGCKTGQNIGWGTPTAPKALRFEQGRGFEYGPLPVKDGEESQAHFEKRVDRHYYAHYDELMGLLEAARTPAEIEVAQAAVERHRDRVLFDLLTEVDDAYHQFEKQLIVGPSVSNLIWDWIDLGLDATAAAMTPVSTKTILSTIATGVEGARLSVDKNVFRQQTYELINLTMRAARQEVLNEISMRLEADRASPGFDYTLEEVIRDLARYYYAGSVTTALGRMVELAGDDYQRQEDVANSIRSGEMARRRAATDAREAARSSALDGLRGVLDRLDTLDARLDG